MRRQQFWTIWDRQPTSQQSDLAKVQTAYRHRKQVVQMVYVRGASPYVSNPDLKGKEMMKPLMIVSSLLLAAPVAAQQSFAAPEGCTGTLTVQHKGCVMVNVWSCDADAEGDQWIALIGQGGVFSVQKVDSEFQWIEAFKITGSEVLQTPAPDPASLTDLFAEQIDTWDFTLETEGGIERNVGYDMLTGETTVIDGVTLLNTQYEGRVLDGDGNEIDAGSGRQFVSEDFRLFFFGESWDAADPSDIVDMSPLEFIFPGEPGFFTDQPVYECNQMEAGFRP